MPKDPGKPKEKKGKPKKTQTKAKKPKADEEQQKEVKWKRRINVKKVSASNSAWSSWLYEKIFATCYVALNDELNSKINLAIKKKQISKTQAEKLQKLLETELKILNTLQIHVTEKNGLLSPEMMEPDAAIKFVPLVSGQDWHVSFHFVFDKMQGLKNIFEIELAKMKKEK